MNEALQASLEDLFEQAPCGYIFTRPDGTFIRVNRMFLAWTGYEREDLVGSGKRFQELLTKPSQIFHENQYAPLLHLQGHVTEVAFDIVRRDGGSLPVLVNSVLRSDGNGHPLLIVSTIFNATDRRAYERELLIARRNAEQLAAVVTASDDAIVSASPTGDIQTWNPGAERMFGYRAQAIVGTKMQSLLAPDEDHAAWQARFDELRQRRPVHFDTIGRHFDGRHVDVSVGLMPHVGLLGELVAVSAIIRDIGPRRALERMQHEFIAMATHELRSPVAGIKAHAQLMRRRGTYREHSVDLIISQADRMGRLVDDLLLASQIDAARLDLHLDEVEISVEARSAVEYRGTSGASIRVETPDVPTVVLADRQRIGQVLTNLLTNAVKYSPEGAAVVVRLATNGDEVRVAVIDQGVGIPAESLPHLFDRFYRVSGSSERAPGLGLGLYISQSIAKAHGGRIEVESEPGRGSTFTLVLPLVGTSERRVESG